MKLLKTLAAVLFIAVLGITYTACEKEDEESCEQQDMSEVLTCDGEKNVEVCCVSGSSCTYKYDGQEYPDTQAGLNDLADALGCTYKSTEEYEKQKEMIIERLIAMRNIASCGN